MYFLARNKKTIKRIFLPICIFVLTSKAPRQLLLMSMDSIYFHGEMKKNLYFRVPLLSGAMSDLDSDSAITILARHSF